MATIIHILRHWFSSSFHCRCLYGSSGCQVSCRLVSLVMLCFNPILELILVLKPCALSDKHGDVWLLFFHLHSCCRLYHLVRVSQAFKHPSLFSSSCGRQYTKGPLFRIQTYYGASILSVMFRCIFGSKWENFHNTLATDADISSKVLLAFFIVWLLEFPFVSSSRLEPKPTTDLFRCGYTHDTFTISLQ